MLSTGLPVSRYVSVSVYLTTRAVIAPAINTLLVVGTSEVIETGERARTYGSISDVAEDFGTDAAEYHAADTWFSQSPRPDNLMIGRWLKEASHAELICGILTPAEQMMSNWNTISPGSFRITVDGRAPINVTGLSFPNASHPNLNAVANTITNNTVMQAQGVTCHWAGDHFVFTTNSSGVTASIDFLQQSVPLLGTDMSTRLKGTATTGAHIFPGEVSESAVSAVAHIDALYSSQFYGIVVPEADDDEQMELAAYVEAADPPHYLGVTSSDPACADRLSIDDIAYRMHSFGYNKTAVQFSTTNPYAICSYLGRILTTNWTGMNTAITLMYKRQPGVGIEFISSTQANALQEKECNVYTGVSNGAQIIQYGTSASGEYTDTIIGADAFALDIQAGIFNALYVAPTKIAQTDFGMGILVNTATGVCAGYALNGWIGPGSWTAPGFGQLNYGDLLSLVYYVYAPSIAWQAAEDRAARRAPVIMVAAKCAGAIHQANVVVFVNQ